MVSNLCRQRICEYVTFYGKTDYGCDYIKDLGMVEIILDYPDGVSTVKNTLIRGRQGPQSQRRNYEDGSRG